MTLPSRFFGAGIAPALRSALVALTALAALTGCAGAAIPVHDSTSDPQAFPSWFEANRAHGRAVLLLSPV